MSDAAASSHEAAPPKIAEKTPAEMAGGESSHIVTSATDVSQNAWRLYTSYGLLCGSAQLWQFAAGLILFSTSNQSLLRPAIFGLVVYAAAGLLGPIVAPLLEKRCRFAGSVVAVSFTSVAVVVSAALLAVLVKCSKGCTALLVLVYVFAGVAAVFDVALSSLLTKEWVTALATSADDRTNVDTTISKIGVWSRLAAPVLAGILLTFTSPFVTSVVAGSFYLVAMVLGLFLLRLLHGETEPVVAATPSTCPSFSESFSFFFEEKTATAAVAAALISLTHLTFASVLNAYLKHEAVTEVLIAVFFVCAVLVELFALFSFDLFVSLFRQVPTAAIAVWLEVFCLALCVASTFFSGHLGLGLLIGGTVFSHFGAAIFDKAVSSILKERVQPNQYAGVSRVRTMFRVAFQVIAYGLAVGFHNPARFFVLVYVSFSAVACAAVMFSFWALSNKNEPEPQQQAATEAAPSEATPLLQ